MSSNRPIQNKIKLISVRDNSQNNSMNLTKESQIQLTGSVSNLNILKNPSYYHNSSNIYENKPIIMSNKININESSNQLGKYVPLNSPRDEEKSIN